VEIVSWTEVTTGVMERGVSVRGQTANEVSAPVDRGEEIKRCRWGGPRQG